MKKLLVGLILMASLVACPTPPSPKITSVVINAPSSTSVQVGKTLSLSSTVSGEGAFDGNVNWSLDAAGASISPMKSGSGVATTFTAPTTAGTVNVKATAVGDATKTATIAITVTSTGSGGGSGSIAVNGTLVKWNGSPLDQANIYISDANGATKNTSTDANGKFSFTGVATPYSITAVGATYLPVSYTNVTTAEPKIALRTGTSLFSIGSQGLDEEASCQKTYGHVDITFVQPLIVGTNQRAKLIFIGAGTNSTLNPRPTNPISGIATIGYSPVNSYTNIPLASGTYPSVQTLNIPFDRNYCTDNTKGRVLYLLYDVDANGNTIGLAKSGISGEVNVQTGNTSSTTIVTNIARTKVLSFSTDLPTGITSAFALVFVRDERDGQVAYYPYSQYNLSASTTYPVQFSLPELDNNIQYRILLGGGSRFAWSDLLTGNEANLNLTLPAGSNRISPSGATPGANLSPEFVSQNINTANYYYTAVGTQWVGGSQTSTIKMPSGLPATVGLKLSDNTSTNNYTWYSLNALRVRNPQQNMSDMLLDGRQVRHNFIGALTLSEPDIIESGTFDGTGVNFKITQ